MWNFVILYFVYFSADEAFDGTYPTNVVVGNTGSCTYIPPGIFKSTCKIDITWFPFDDQDCKMKFGSWTYNGFKVNIFSIGFFVCFGFYRQHGNSVFRWVLNTYFTLKRYFWGKIHRTFGFHQIFQNLARIPHKLIS